MRKNYLGILYSIIHFIIEVTSFYIVTTYTNNPLIIILALTYDFFAFIPQGIFGYIKDIGIKINFAIIGMIFSSLSLILLYFNTIPLLVIFILAIGNSLIHIEGAETTLKSSKGKMAPSAIFVAGGSFGIITGKLLAMNNFPVLIILLINLLMIIPILLSRKKSELIDEKNLNYYNFANKKIDYKIIIFLAVFIVAVRAFIGYGIPTSWNKTILQTILLYCFMGIGKGMGGVLIDIIGIRKTAFISTIGALPFLLFGDKIMMISLIGILLFSMTMAITLGLIVSVLKKYPGIAFGFTTIGLFLGSFPLFFFKIDSLIINCIIIFSLTIICMLILNIICRKEKI
ncbi:MAG: hypothetical protein VZS44_09630 [Bacilli bacterium]|nr:hypothetical protein [Bacilli bacterium]